MARDRRDEKTIHAVAAVLREARGDRSQEAVARDADLTIGTYGRIERARADPAWSKIARIASVLGLSMAELGRRVDAELQDRHTRD